MKITKTITAELSFQPPNSVINFAYLLKDTFCTLLAVKTLYLDGLISQRDNAVKTRIKGKASEI